MKFVDIIKLGLKLPSCFHLKLSTFGNAVYKKEKQFDYSEEHSQSFQ